MFGKPQYINAGGRLLDLSTPLVMGIINVTPDSFYAGSRLMGEADILNSARKMVDDGATIIDVGGYSSRPGAQDITEADERGRVLRAIRIIKNEIPDSVVSIDTFRSAVAAEAVEKYGADIINDISGGEADPAMFKVLGRLNVPYIIMHMRGNPRNMQDNTDYDDIVADILKWFSSRIYTLRSAGIKDIILDPGFGFSKNIEQNFEMLRRLMEFSVAGLPLLAGLSRKSTIWKTLGVTPSDALNGTSVLNTIALMNGADILRVHDVKEAVEAVKLVGKVRSFN